MGIVRELGARSVLDVGCGTGVLALLLADDGLEVTGVDPARASLDLARAKPGAGRVTWLDGDATTLPPMAVDVATMTANVAQVFVDDADWEATLRGVAAALRPGGHLVFETRVPERRAWEGWTAERTHQVADVPGVGRVETWTQVGAVEPGLVTFRSTTRFPDGEERHSDSTLRFRDRDELRRSLAAAGLEVVDVRDAPDRPGREWVHLARRT